MRVIFTPINLDETQLELPPWITQHGSIDEWEDVRIPVGWFFNEDELGWESTLIIYGTERAV